jgi:GNAT superfamily N-acetyltransferase
MRQALRGDLAEIVDIWTEAFAADPYFRWIAPDDETYATFGPAWMTFVAELVFERGHTALDADAGFAVAWVPPDLALVQPDDFVRGRAIMAEAAGDQRADDAVATILLARGQVLEEPHWTLQYIGGRDRARGAGVGAAAVRPWLDACDRDGLPCALISSNPRNLTFYERLGFAVTGEVPTPDGAATLRPMVRSAR